MRIVFISYEFPPQFGGGIGTYVAAMSKILAARGHGVTVVTISKTRYPQRDRQYGIELIRLPLSTAGGAEPLASLRSWQSRADAIADLLNKITSAQNVDIIEFADYRGEGVTYLSCTTPETRPFCVVKLHTCLGVLNKYNCSRIRYPVLESFENQAILQADRLVSPSAALIAEMRLHLSNLPAVDLLPYPADPAFLEHPPASNDPREEILYVGRLEERKGVETLIQAAPRVLDACPKAVLHLVGGDTQVSATISSMKSHLLELLPERYRNRVAFHGAVPRPELIDRYLAARVCVFPSLFENFPNTCLESMALGRPVIGTDNSGMAEMIEDGISGRIVRAGDVEHLATTLIEVYNLSAAERGTMGQAARQRIHDRYQPDRIAQEFETLYDGYSRIAAKSQAVPTYVAQKPVVAVVIPCFNHGKYIRETLDSIKAQDWPNVQTIIVDDGSTDDETVNVLEKLKVEGFRVIRQQNQGLAAARNTGVRATDAPFFVPLDADDRIAPDFISKLISPLLQDESLGYCYSHVTFFGAADGVWQCAAYDPRKILVENLSVATAAIRRSAFDVVGGYNREMIYGFEDWDFWLALLSVGYHGRCVPEPLFYYRKHPRGQSMLDKTQQHRAEMVHKMIEHHRTLFATMLEVSLTDKDSMFFQAHMQAAHLREAVAKHGVAIPLHMEDELYQALVAQAQLDHIENSNTWRLVQRIKRNAFYRWAANLRYGPEWERVDPNEGPRERLARIKASRFYRLIRATKNSAIYKWYARRKYGPDFADPLSAR